MAYLIQEFRLHDLLVPLSLQMNKSMNLQSTETVLSGDIVKLLEARDRETHSYTGIPCWKKISISSSLSIHSESTFS